MTCRFDTSTDAAVGTLSSALTIGTGAFWLMLPVRFHAGFSPAAAQDILLVDDANPGSGAGLGFGFGILSSDATRVAAYWDTSPRYTTGYVYTTNVQYFLFASRSGSTFRFRIFDDTTSTTPLYDVTQDDATLNRTGLDTLIFGAKSGGSGAAPCDFGVMKLGTGATLTDAECRTETQTWLIQKTGLTDKVVLRLNDTKDNFGGLKSVPEVGQPTVTLTNSGCVDGKTRPTQLERLGAYLENLTTYAPPDSSTAISISHKCQGDNRYLLLAYGDGYNEHGAFSAGPAFNGDALTSLGAGGVSSDLNSQMRVWGLVNPDEGTFNVTFTVPLTNGREGAIVASYANVDPDNPVFASQGANGDSGTATLNVEGGAVVADFLCHYQNTAGPTVGADQIVRARQDTASGPYYCSYFSEEYGYGTRTLSWTLGTSSGWSQFSVALKTAPVRLVTEGVEWRPW